MEPYEIVDHTAEIGIKAYGRTREELFAHMAQGMFSLIVPPEEVQAKIGREVTAHAEGWERLLISWLRELLYLFDTERFLGRSFTIQKLESTEVQAAVSGEILDFNRHHVDKEVKAATYCDLKLVKGPDGIWAAQVIFDI